MSVQAGIWSFEGEAINPSLLSTISRCPAEFGHDGEAMQRDGDIAMLYRPLHTTPESRLEHQPYVSTSGKTVMWDGRLDNRDDLISQLRTELTDCRSDVALVAAAIDCWREKAFSKIIGDWALTIWDPGIKELLLARDFVGIRQLFYWLGPKMIIWSSHLAALVSCGTNFSLSDEYVAGYLSMWPAAHLTPYREISAVPPGHFVRIRNRTATASAYWKFDHRSKIYCRTDAEYEEKFRHLLRQAVRRRLRTDSPVLAELSGGLDSSSIVCMADDIRAKEGAQAPRMDTFSYFDHEEPDEDDSLYFTQVEEQRGRTGHHAEIRGTGDTLSFSYANFAATPGFGGRREIETALLELVTKAKYRVILSGIGGDELLGQALDPRVQMADLLVHGRVANFAKQMTAWSLLMRRPWLQLLWEVVSMLLPTSPRVGLSGRGDQEPWVNDKFSQEYKLSARLLAAAEGRWWWTPSRRDSLQTLANLSGQLTCAVPFMAERRYPYLDQTLVEFLSQIPPDQLVRPGERRFLMRRALRNLVPAEILRRRTKSAEGRCYAITLNKHWAEIQPLLGSLRVCEFGYIKPNEFQTALVGMKSGQLSPHYVRLLRALSLELWLRDAYARGVISNHGPPEIHFHLRSSVAGELELPGRTTSVA